MPEVVYPLKEATLKLIRFALENGIIARKDVLKCLEETNDGKLRPEKMVWTDPYA